MRRSGSLYLLLCMAIAGQAFAGGVPRIHASGYETFSCQNGAIEEAEQCDDGNGNDRDGCTSQCRKAVACTAAAFPDGDRFLVDAERGRCYVVQENDLVTFSDAAVDCAALGGHLATLTSAGEAALLQPALLAGQRPWIGAADLSDTGSFAWLTGESFQHQAFAPGQPDGDGNCLVVEAATGLWSDSPCDLVGYATGHVCEFEP